MQFELQKMFTHYEQAVFPPQLVFIYIPDTQEFTLCFHYPMVKMLKIFIKIIEICLLNHTNNVETDYVTLSSIKESST